MTMSFRRGFFVALRMAGIGATTAILLHAADVAPRMLLLDAATVGSDVIAVGERGTILTSNDAAKSWHRATVSATATLTAVTFADNARHGWAVGHDALILATTDGG